MVNGLGGHRFGSISGIVASILIITGGIIGDINSKASVTSAPSVIADTLVENRTKILAGTYLTILGVFFLLCFVAYLRAYLVAAIGDKNWLSSVAFGGGLVACSMLLLSAHFSQAFTILSSYGVDTQVAKALYVLDWNDNLLVEAPALAALVGATAAIGIIYKIFPWWLNVWGALLTLLLLGPVLPGSGVMLTFIWMIVLSGLLLVRTIKV